MAVILKTPWQGHPAGARLALAEADERQLVRGGAATFAPPLEIQDREAAPLAAPVRKPGRPRKVKG